MPPQKLLFHVWRFARPYLTLTVLGLVLLIPLSGVAVPCTDDGQLYYYQTAVLQYQVSEGLLFSRWLPDVALGYGLPFFNYREPLPRYLVLLPSLTGLSVPQALNLVSAGLIIVTGWGSYQFTRDVFDDQRAGMVAGVAAMSAPYILIDIYQRGNLPESVALALIPWVLWAFWKTTHSQRRALAMLTAALLWTTLLLSHNISVLLFTPFLFCYVLMLWLLSDRAQSAFRTGPWLAFVDGLGLAAFYWLPAVFETELVQLGRAISAEGNRYDRNFLTVGEAFGASMPHNPAWLNPTLEIKLGIILLLFALIGVVVGWLAHRHRTQRAHIILLAATAVIYLLLAFPISKPLWDVAPLLPFVQFPWRLIGRAALLLAPLAGLAVSGSMKLIEERWPSGRFGWLSALIGGWACLMLLGEGLMHTYPAFCFPEPYPTITDVHQFEQDRLIGLDNEASYFPADVSPPESTPLLTDYTNASQPQRFDPARVPADASVVITYRALGANMSINTPQPFEARYLAYQFPGWFVRLDGQPLALSADSNGLIVFDVPQGQHSIQIRFAPTPFRGLAIGVSVISLLGLIVDIYPTFELRRQRQADNNNQVDNMLPFWMTLLLIGVALFSTRLFLPEQTTAPWQVARLPTPEQPIGAVFNGQVVLLGVDRLEPRIQADEALLAISYWQRITQMPEVDTGVVWRVLDDDGINWAEADGGPPRGTDAHAIPTHAWATTAFASDSQLVRLQPGTPAGSYVLAATLFEKETFAPFATEFNGQTTTSYPVQDVEVAWPGQPPTIDALGIQYQQEQAVGDGLTLLGYNLDREAVTPGESILLSLFWQVDIARSDYPSAVLVIDDSSIDLTMPSADGTIPAGARWRTQHLVRIPPEVGDGNQLLSLEVSSNTIDLRPIDVALVTRVFDVPPTQYPVNTAFETNSGAIQLAGFNIEPGATQLGVSLLWQASGSIAQSYVVFVHALDANDTILSQSDSVPARGERPTIGWLDQEVILDTHTLSISAGDVSAVRVGLYDPVSGQRLATIDGRDSIVVDIIP